MDQPAGPLRIGFIGSGFIARFHVTSFQAVRNAVVAGVYSPHAEHRASLAQLVDDLDVGPCRTYDSVESMITSGEIDAVWILGPNDSRISHMQAIHAAVKSGEAVL